MKIHILNARDNVILPVMNKVYKNINMFEEINNEFKIFLDILKKRKFNMTNYLEL